MPDRGCQVRLAQANTAIDEQRVVFLTRLVGYRERRRVRKLVTRSDYELVERVAGI